MSVGRRVVTAGLATLGLVGVFCGQTEFPPTTPSPARPANPQVIPPEMQLGPLPLRAPGPFDNPATPAKIALSRLWFFDPMLSATKGVFRRSLLIEDLHQGTGHFVCLLAGQ